MCQNKQLTTVNQTNEKISFETHTSSTQAMGNLVGDHPENDQALTQSQYVPSH